MTIEEFNICKKTYDDCVVQGLLYPDRLREAYWLISGTKDVEPIVSIRKCKGTIYSFFQHRAAQVLSGLTDLMLDDGKDTDTTVTNVPPVIPPKEEQSHSEDFEVQNQPAVDSIKKDYDKYKGIELTEVEKLQAEYDVATDANVKRSLKMRLNKLIKDNE